MTSPTSRPARTRARHFFLWMAFLAALFVYSALQPPPSIEPLPLIGTVDS